MRKKDKTRNIIIGVFLIVGLILILSLTGTLKLPFAVGTTFTPIYCNDYSFTCCNEQLDYNQRFTVDRDDVFICPETATKCIINSGGYYRIGSHNCRYGYFPLKWIFGNSWDCDDDITVSGTQTVYPGEYVLGSILNSDIPGIYGSATLNIDVYDEELIFCGRAGCTIGVPVSGADDCTFNPSATYKDGKLVDYEVSATSYTVNRNDCLLTFVPGDRHICGNVEESCATDADCRGHTYGNFECIGRTLQEYGCRTFSKPWYLEEYSNGYAYKPFQGDNDGIEPDLSRCEIVNTRTVQCCGDTDCGSNAFCDVGNTWTCKETAECTQDYDCGVSIQCDINLKQLKKPICSIGRCTYDIVQEVDCCSDSDCAIGYFCSNEYTCLESVPHKTTCPFECCENEQKYFDRPCPEDKPYCIDNICKSKLEPKIPCEDCDAFAKSKLLGWISPSLLCKPKIISLPPQTISFCIFSFIKLILVPIVLIFGTLFGTNFFTQSKFFKIKNKVIAFLLSLILAAGLAYLTFLFFWVGIILALIYIILTIILKTIKPF